MNIETALSVFCYAQNFITMNESELQMDKKGDLPWGFWVSIGLSSLIILIYFIAQFAVAFLMASFPGMLGSLKSGIDFANGFVISISIIVSAPICLLVTIFFIKMRKGMTVREYLDFRMPITKDFLKWFVFMAVLMVFFDLFSWVIHRPLIPHLMLDAYKTAIFIPLFLTAVIIIGPFFEEVIFRGFLFKGIEYSKLGTISALWLTAFFWSIIHFQYDFFGTLNVFALGLLLGAARLKTGSIYLTIVMHWFNNLVSTIEILIHVHLLN